MSRTEMKIHTTQNYEKRAGTTHTLDVDSVPSILIRLRSPNERGSPQKCLRSLYSAGRLHHVVKVALTMGAPPLSQLIRCATVRSPCCSPSTSKSSSSITLTRTARWQRCAQRGRWAVVNDLVLCKGVVRAYADRTRASEQAGEPGSAPRARALASWHVCARIAAQRSAHLATRRVSKVDGFA